MTRPRRPRPTPPGTSDPEPGTGDADLTLRALDRQSDLRQCVELQEATWGAGFTEAVPPSILLVTQRIGGVAAGAFESSGRLAGFVFGLAGIDEDGEPIHWSDMLAVRPEHRGTGLGRRLKRWQRDRCRERGVRRMHWTYDPLESRNAWLNLGRLGAVAREYVVDMYGPGESPLHEGIGTDRLVVTWELESDRTEARLAGRGSAPPAWEGVQQLPRAFEVDTSGPRPRPVPSDAGVMDGGAALLVPIPADVQALKAVDPAGAVDWREATRAALAPRLADGWEIRELVRSPGPVSHYLVVRPGEEPGEPATDAP